MKKILIILVVALFAFSCSSSKSNVPDDDNSDSDNSTVTDETLDETADEAIDDRMDNQNDKDTGEIVDEKPDETADEVADETADETVDEKNDGPSDDDTSMCAENHCEIDGECYDNGTVDPMHLCNICDPETNKFDWTPVASGTVCRIASGECDISEKCDGINAECPADVFKPLDTACGDVTDTDCDNPDTCDGYGVCKENFVAEFTACPDDNDDCNGAESCDGSGSCISEGPNVVCGDNEICNPVDGTCGCDEANNYFLSADEAFCAFAGNKIPPTGQTKCYNATIEIACPTHASGLPFFGQDAQYTDNPRTFTIVGESPDRVVTDSLTGLTWELDYDSNTKTWDEAKTYCTTLGGDWRMPTLKELRSTLNFNHSTPACDTTYCPLNSGRFWSITNDPSNNLKALVTYFYTGDIRTPAKTESHYVRCVKGTPFDPSGVITDDGHATEPVATDSLTGLSWTNSRGLKSWQNALDHCEKLTYGGHDDWRLPNINEMQTVMEYTPTLGGIKLPNTGNANHWTSTTYIDVTNSAFYFSVTTGINSRGIKANNFDHVCVR